MTTMDNTERSERRARQRELADRLKASGALDGIFEQIDAGQVPLGGDDGLLRGMLRRLWSVIMNDIRLRGLAVAGSDTAGARDPFPAVCLTVTIRP